MAKLLDTLSAAAGRAVDTAKVGIAVAAQEQKIRSAYLALGKLYYRNIRNGNPLTGPAFDGLVAEIETANQTIAKLKNADLVDPADFEEI